MSIRLFNESNNKQKMYVECETISGCLLRSPMGYTKGGSGGMALLLVCMTEIDTQRACYESLLSPRAWSTTTDGSKNKHASLYRQKADPNSTQKPMDSVW